MLGPVHKPFMVLGEHRSRECVIETTQAFKGFRNCCVPGSLIDQPTESWVFISAASVLPCCLLDLYCKIALQAKGALTSYMYNGRSCHVWD